MRRVPVYVFGPDPITQAGVASQLRGRPEVRIVEESPDFADVALVCLEDLDAETAASARAVQRNGCPKIVLVLANVDDVALATAVELGAVGLVRRSEATSERLAEAVVVAARGDASLPSDLLARLLRQLKEAGDGCGGLLHQTALTPRETDVLRLIADGQDTRQIAGELCYSERTIKNIIQDVTRRFGLRNRSHAVAYALRQGLI